mmetsp:Transcript_33526/g.75223  ORF Transcript_33526/g.75223 Transcript_33526/m.75223 type:complete len:232 (+) Transcript_33526:67-762(+)
MPVAVSRRGACSASGTCRHHVGRSAVLIGLLAFVRQEATFQLCGRLGGTRRCVPRRFARPPNLEIGDSVTATVSAVDEMWVKANIEGAGQGSIHVSDLSSLRLRHAREVVQVGDVVKCFVKQFKKDNTVLTTQDIFQNRTRISEMQPGLEREGQVVHLNKHIGAFVDIGAVTSALIPRDDFVGWTIGAKSLDMERRLRKGTSVRVEVTKVDTGKGQITAKLVSEGTPVQTD